MSRRTEGPDTEAGSRRTCPDDGGGQTWRTHTNPSLGSVSREAAQKVCSVHVSCRMDGRLGGCWLDLVCLEYHHLTFSEKVAKR